MTARESKAVAHMVIEGGIDLDAANLIAQHSVRRAGHLWWFVAPDVAVEIAALTPDSDHREHLLDVAAVLRNRKDRRVTDMRRKYERAWARHDKRRRPTRPAHTDTDQQEVPT